MYSELISRTQQEVMEEAEKVIAEYKKRLEPKISTGPGLRQQIQYGTTTTTTGTISPSAYTTVTTSSGVTISYAASSTTKGFKIESKKSKQETDDLVNIWTKVSEQ